MFTGSGDGPCIALENSKKTGTMKTHRPLKRLYTAMLPLGFMAMLAAACSSPGSTKEYGTTGVIDENGNGTTQDETEAMNASNAAQRTEETPVARTPAEERSNTASDLRGLRASLVKELDEVRARLNNGTNPYPERETDQTRAAELAQGLERIDGALATLDASTDALWASTREAQMKEVEDVRAWLRTHEHTQTSVKH